MGVHREESREREREVGKESNREIEREPGELGKSECKKV